MRGGDPATSSSRDLLPRRNRLIAEDRKTVV